MDGQFSCDKFDYVWRYISLDSLLIDKEVDNCVDVYNDGQFEPETEAEEFVVEIVLADEDNNDDNDNDDNDNESMKDEEQNDYFDDKEPAPEEKDDNDMGNDNYNNSVDDQTINKQDDDSKVEQEK